jgi:tetratricopeptide (TPR) repeat protein
VDEPAGKALDWSGKTVVLIGRLAQLPRRLVVRQLVTLGATVRQGVTRRTGVIVLGRGASALLGRGRLAELLDRADRIGARLLSENAFLRALGLLPPPDRRQRTLPLDEIARLTRLDPSTLRMLTLFDVIEPEEGLCSFQDLITARTAARLLAGGLAVAEVIGSVLRLRERAAPPGNAIASLVHDARSGVALRIDGALTELDGQLRLPLGEAGNPGADELYDAAVLAEDNGDWAEAARLYRRCFDVDRGDPTPAFNLANVLCRLGRTGEAQLYLRLAVAIDPALAEAWYNLARLAEEAGDPVQARAHLERALAADPGYGDATYNLAYLCCQTGDYREAARLWERYLSLDAHGPWADKARRGLALCRMQLTTRPATDR